MMFLLVVTTWLTHFAHGLVSRTKLKTLTEFNTIGDIETIFSSLSLTETGLNALVRLLTNGHFRVGALYWNTCSRMSWEKFIVIVEFAKDLHPLQRDRLLGKECLDLLSFSQSAYRYIRDKKIPTPLPKRIEYESSGEWAKILSIPEPELITGWCKRIPKRHLTDNFLAKVDLPYYISPKCIKKDYRNKSLIITALMKQIPSAKQSSLTRLLLSLGSIESKYAPTIRTAVKKCICGSRANGDPFHLVNAKFLRCVWANEHPTDKMLDFMLKPPKVHPTDNCELESSKVHSENIINGLRVWYRRMNLVNVTGTLRTRETQLPYSDHLIVLLNDVCMGDLVQQFCLFQRIGIDLNILSRYVPPMVWPKQTGAQHPLYLMPLEWRLSYYRSWKMFPRTRRRPRVRHMLKSLHYSSSANIKDAMRFFRKIVDESFFIYSKEALRDGPNMVVPDPSINLVDLECVLDIMVYSIIQDETSLVIFSDEYCEQVYSSNFNHDHYEVFKRVHTKWKLWPIAHVSRFCHNLTEDVRRLSGEVIDKKLVLGEVEITIKQKRMSSVKGI